MISSRKLQRILKQYQAVLLLTVPALAGMLLFQFYPLLVAARVSLFDFNMVSGDMNWRGLGNYLTAARDPLFLRSLSNTALFFLMKVPFQMALALGLAMLVRQPFLGAGIMRTMVLVPTVTSMVVVSVLWGLMYHPNHGLLNGLLAAAGLPAQPFLISADQSLPSIVAMTVWKDVGFNMIFFLAGLTAIPREFYEAAMIDGANRWQLFRSITLPLLRRTTLFVLVTSMIAAFKVFTPVFLTTRGGPSGSTRVAVLYIYENAFLYNRMGYAAALSVILAVILLTASLFQLTYRSPTHKIPTETPSGGGAT